VALRRSDVRFVRVALIQRILVPSHAYFLSLHRILRGRSRLNVIELFLLLILPVFVERRYFFLGGEVLRVESLQVL
jgi:hypothetical protein